MEHSLRPGFIALLAALPLMAGIPAGTALADGPVTPQGAVADSLSAVLNPRSTTPYPASSTGSPQINAIVNGASFLPGVAPGALITLFISNAQLLTEAADSTPLPIGLGGGTVSINKTLMPLLYTSPTQINAQLPYATPTGNTAVTLAIARTSGTLNVTVVATAPGIFMYGTNRAVAQNQNYSLNNTSTPAARGSVITVYLTGGGALDNPVTSGSAAPSAPLSRVTASYSATIGGQNASVLFLGLTPGFVGLYQADVQVPNNLSGPFPKDFPVIITVGGNASNAPLVTIN